VFLSNTQGYFGLQNCSATTPMSLISLYDAMSSMPPTERENNLAEMHSLIARDLTASNELAARITQLRQDIAEGKPQPPKKVDLLERSNKDMTKELVLRVERIESVPVGRLEAADREMLQALNARLAVCDMQAMRLAELRDLEFTARNTKERVFLEAEVDEGFDVAGREPEEELAIGNTSKHAIAELDRDTKELRHHNDDRHEGFESSEEDTASEDPPIDKSAWPLLYQIMNVDPGTSAADIQPLVHG
jgi:hypothetical protein